MTDHGSISAAAAVMKACKDCCKCGHQKRSHSASLGLKCQIKGCSCGCFDKASVKPLLGSEFYLCKGPASDRSKENGKHSHLCVVARGQEGWKNLIKASSDANRPEHFYRRPRLDLDRLAAHANGQWVVFSGHPGSDMADVLFADIRAAYGASTYEAAYGQLTDDWKRKAVALACRYRDLFGKDNFRLEIQLVDRENMPAVKIIAQALRKVSKWTGIPCLATADSHYPSRSDAGDQRVLLCAAFETTLAEVERKVDAGEDVVLGGFFRSNRYHIPSSEEMEELHKDHPEELLETLKIAEGCQVCDVLREPMLPVFECPDGMNQDDYLRTLCEEGWKNKLSGRERGEWIDGIRGSTKPLWEEPDSIPTFEYRDRLDRELGVVKEAGLAGYLLIVQDFCNWARSNGFKVGEGRGSAAGSLAGYLSWITDVDPMMYGLLFERFYNAGRNTPGKPATLPDIDIDFEKHAREKVIAYVRRKYGTARVAQMATFNMMQGRSAIKNVLRANSSVPPEEMNRITENIPDKASIADHLQEMLEETGEASIIRWALEYESAALKPWVTMNEDGSLDGQLAKEFEQAIRLEGTFNGQSKHASGVIISAVDLAEVVPMCYDKTSEEMIVAVDMRDAEAMGQVKFDILGTVVLDRLKGWANTMRTGRVA